MRMQEMQGKKVCVALLAVIWISVIVLLSGCGQQTANAETEMVYYVSFGLNDADTGAQEVSMEDASAYIRGVIESYGCGYTEYRTYGAYTEDGVSRGNDTLVYMFVYVEETDIEAIANEAIAHLNLASVLCQAQEMECTFYVGEEKQQ